MNVDGTTNATTHIGSPQRASTPPERLHDRTVRRRIDGENQLATTANSKEAGRLSPVTQDTFEHIAEVSGPVTYRDHPPGTPVGERSNAPRGQEYPVKIADLETTVNATGLPLLPEPASQGVFSQEVLGAYEATDERDPGQSGDNGQHPDVLDTLG